jgi:N-dimethylarginine dimethylaminohydrolase
MKNIFCENKKDFKNILVCRPTYFGIDYEINPWMSKNSKTSKKIFLKQWDLLCKILKESGAKLNKILPQKNLPDMVFTANAGLYLKDTKTLVFSKFKHKERQGETKHFADYFENRGDKVVFTKCDLVERKFIAKQIQNIYDNLTEIMPELSFFNNNLHIMPVSNLESKG